MKPNVKMIDNSKNSFIYFQLGLIAAMVTVLFVLEFNFKTEVLKEKASTNVSFPEDIVFTYNPKLEETKAKPRLVTKTNPIVKVVQPKIINQFIKTETEVNDDIIKDVSDQDSTVSSANSSTNQNANTVDGNSGNTGEEEKVFVVVEFLPRFPGCVNVSKESQKECFDSQLKKEIFKYLKYPERDLENKNEGTVFVQFIVDENGNFTSIKSAENNRATNDMRVAVENAVKKLPKIIPAKQGQKDVKVTYTIPISFKIGK
jgi:protein TonB